MFFSSSQAGRQTARELKMYSGLYFTAIVIILSHLETGTTGIKIHTIFI